jgi:hypothetical protein
MREAKKKDLIDALSGSFRYHCSIQLSFDMRWQSTQRASKRRKLFFGSGKFMRICPCHDRGKLQKGSEHGASDTINIQKS